MDSYVLFPDWFCIRMIYDAVANQDQQQLDAAYSIAMLAEFSGEVSMSPRRRDIHLDSPLLTRIGDLGIVKLTGQYGSRKEVITKLLWAEELHNETFPDGKKTN